MQRLRTLRCIKQGGSTPHPSQPWSVRRWVTQHPVPLVAAGSACTSSRRPVPRDVARSRRSRRLSAAPQRARQRALAGGVDHPQRRLLFVERPTPRRPGETAVEASGAADGATAAVAEGEEEQRGAERAACRLDLLSASPRGGFTGLHVAGVSFLWGGVVFTSFCTALRRLTKSSPKKSAGSVRVACRERASLP